MTTPTKTLNDMTIDDVPLPLDLRAVKDITRHIKRLLMTRYNNHYLNGNYRSQLCDDEEQLILSFAFPRVRSRHCDYLDSYNYCMICKRFKERDKMNNSFCMNGANSWRCEITEHYSHKNYAICYDCLDDMCEYGFTHHKENRKPICPVCANHKTFHHINLDKIYHSHPSWYYTRDILLDYNASTPKKFKRCKYDTGIMRNKYQRIYRNYDYVYDINSFQFKLSMLYRILLDRWKLPVKTWHDDMDNLGYLQLKDITKQNCKDLLDELKGYLNPEASTYDLSAFSYGHLPRDFVRLRELEQSVT
jgi:hypothetical protein